jgi:energy-coupling factor transporter transmembrane protein EcfT
MRITVVIADILLKLSGLALLALGLFFWAGKALDLLPLHMLLGAVFVIALWTIAVLGWRAGLGMQGAVLRLAWGVIVLILGLTQSRILPGAEHWIIQGLHLFVGGFAINLGARFATRMKKGLPAAQAPGTRDAA